MNVYTELLTIKRVRENEAEMHVARERSLALAAREASEQADAMLAQLQREANEAGQRLYGDLCERVVHVRDIDEVKVTIITLRERVSMQQQAVDSARAVHRDAERRLVEARQALMHAHRQTSKFIDLEHRAALEAQRDAEQREELEIEDATTALRHGRESHAVESEEILL